jgi:outer membrane protein assembly factor BamB
VEHSPAVGAFQYFGEDQAMLALQANALLLALFTVQRTYIEDVNGRFLAAAKRGDAAVVEALLAKGAEVNAKTRYGGTALAFAADKGHLQVVRILLKHKANVNAKDSFYSATPFSWALSKEHIEIIKALLEAGATGADTALLTAVRDGKVDLTRAILEKGKPKPETLSTALAMVPANQRATADLLTKAGGKPGKPGFALDADTLKSYAGRYEGEGIEVQLVPQDGKMLVKLEERTLFVLRPTDKTSFKPIGNEGVTGVTMSREGDKVTGFGLKTLVSTLTFKRIEPGTAQSPAAKPKAERGPVQIAAPLNWPSFRGPGASGVADGQMPPLTWDAGKGDNIVWKAPIPGLGHSSPIVWGNRIFVTSAISGDPQSKFRPGQYGDVDSVNDQSIHKWRVYCLDKRNGNIVWEQTAHEGVPKIKRHMKSTHANPSPATDGKHVIACFGSEGLFCYDVSGNLLWKRDLGVLDSGWFYDPDYQWGFASSPIIYRNLVIVQCDIGKNSFIAAYHVADGSRAWLTPRDEVPSWGTPTIYEGNTGAEIITNATKFIRGYDPLTGKELWRLGKNSEVTVGTPVCGHGLIFVTGGYPPIRPVYAVRAGAKGDISLPKGKTSNEFVAWSNDKNGTYMPTPIVYGEHLYTCGNNGLVTCYEAKTGKQIYQRRIGGRGGYTASPVAADGRLYFASEEGGVLVVKAGPTYELLSTNSMNDVCMATPAISDGMIFIRTQHYLFGIGRQDASRSSVQH